MPVVPSVIRPRGDSDRQRSRQLVSVSNPLTIRFCVRGEIHIDKFASDRRDENAKTRANGAAYVDEVKDVKLMKLGLIDLQDIKYRYEKAVLDGTACEDSSPDEYMAPPRTCTPADTEGPEGSGREDGGG